MTHHDSISFRIKNDIKALLFQKLFIPLYKKASLRSLNQKKVVFIDDKNPILPDSMRLLWKHLEEYYEYELHFISLLHTNLSQQSYLLNCVNMIKDIGDASYIFLNDASEIISMLPLRPDTKVIQLWHACGAFKKWGRGTSSLSSGRSLEYHEAFPGYANLDTVTISSSSVAWAYSDAMGIDAESGIIQALGVSRTDIFFDTMHLKHAKMRIRTLVSQAKDKKIILYAPTFRGDVTQATSPSFLDYSLLKKHLGQHYIIIIKHHPFVKNPPCIPTELQDFVIEAPRSASIDELMIACDACITDYSSLVFEYALLKKPLLFFAPDRDEYADWRGFYYTIEDFDCFPLYSSTSEVLRYIQHEMSSFDPSCIYPFIEKYMAACDGNATRRIVDHVFSRDRNAYKKPSLIPGLIEQNPDGKDLSIIIPAHNAQDSLAYCLESVLMQTYSLARMEILVVDDCSDDATYDIMCAYAEQFPHLFTIMRTEKPTGSPSIPRNKALEEVQGTYIFFLDGDDWINPQAVYKMLKHAYEWESDVVAVKILGAGGRKVARSMFGKNVPRVDIYNSNLMWTFGPWKLFKRDLVKNLRFPQSLPEDISFVLRAYVYAKRVSIASDYEYYTVNYLGDDLAHLSYNTWDKTDDNIAAYKDIFGFIEAHVPKDKRNHTLMRRMLQYVALTLYFLGRRNDPCEEEKYKKIVSLYAPFYKGQSIRIISEQKKLILDAALNLDFDHFCSLISLYDLQDIGHENSLNYHLVDGNALIGYGKYMHHVSNITSALMFSADWVKVTRSDTEKIIVEGYLHASPFIYCLQSRFTFSAHLISKMMHPLSHSSLDLKWITYDKDPNNEAPLTAKWTISFDLSTCPTSWRHLDDKALVQVFLHSCSLYIHSVSDNFVLECRAVFDEGLGGDHAKRALIEKVYAARRIMTHRAKRLSYRFFF